MIHHAAQVGRGQGTQSAVPLAWLHAAMDDDIWAVAGM